MLEALWSFEHVVKCPNLNRLRLYSQWHTFICPGEGLTLVSLYAQLLR